MDFDDADGFRSWDTIPTGKSHRRWNNSNPNNTIISCLLAYTVIFCLWNLWAEPAVTDLSTPSLTISMVDPAKGAFAQLEDQNAASNHWIPLVQNSIAKTSAKAKPRSSSGLVSQDETISHVLFVPREQIVAPTKTKETPSNISTSQKEHLVNLSNSGSQSRRKGRSGLKFSLLLTASSAIVMGGLFAKSALDKLHKWEQQSQEDSLAYDLAYTNSDVSYGSFTSTRWSDDDLDKFDI